MPDENPNPVPEPEVIRKNESSWLKIAQEAAEGLRSKDDIEIVQVMRYHPEPRGPEKLMDLPIQPLNETDIDEATRAATPKKKGQFGRVELGDTDRMELRCRLIVKATIPEVRDQLFGKVMMEKYGLEEQWMVVPYIFRAGESQQVSEAIDRASSYLSDEQRALLKN